MSTGNHDAFSWSAITAVVVAASAVVLPLVFTGNFSGHDFDFHLTSWMDVAQQWHEGIWFPRWAAWANYGFGEPRFIFYPPVSWLLGAALGCWLPWRMVPGTFVWLALVLAGTSMLRLAREWLPLWQATLAAALYAANPYHLLVIYYRSAYAELLASAVFPLLVLYAVRLSRCHWQGIRPLAVVFAAVWLVDPPAAVIASYALALLLAVLATMNRSLGLLVSGAAAIALGTLLAAFYILPAAWEQSWVKISEVLSSPGRPDQNFLFTTVDDPEHTLFNFQVSTVAAVQIVAAAIAALLFDRRAPRTREAWNVLTALAIFSTVLMFPVSWPVWQHLPKLVFVQLPWRWLFPFNVAFSIFCVAARSSKWRRWIACALVAAPFIATGSAMATNGVWEAGELPNLQVAVGTGQGYQGADEYTPIGSDQYDLSQGVPEVAVDSGGQALVRIHVLRWRPEQKLFTADSPRATALALRLVDYPGWRATVNSHSEPIRARPGTAQMLIAVPAGHSRVEVRFTRTRDRTLGAAASALGAAIVTGLAFSQRRRRGNA